MPKEIVKELKKPIFYEYLGNEKEFEDDIFEHIEDICDGFDLPPVLCKTRQKLIQTSVFMIKPDIIVRHDDGSCTIFEVKKAFGEEVFPFSKGSSFYAKEMLKELTSEKYKVTE